MKPFWSTTVDEILNVGIPLSDVGIRNWALTKNDALTSLDQLLAEGVAVLGGDVFALRAERLESNYDNWFCDRAPDEEQSAFVARSINKAKDYVMRYPASSTDEFFFALVPAI
jgi:hypothetical protein